jgi:orotate phosphoribosyltransferase
MQSLRQQFIEFALQAGVLRFGEFTTKAGRKSPYFFNAGLFNRGSLLGQLARFYAQTLLAARETGRLQFDMLFGPAYKGITLASATAVALAELGCDVPFAFNRKEAKDHGEGGLIVGAPLAGRVVVVDDVITAGTSVRESVDIIRRAGATPSGVLIAIDRMERAGSEDAMSAHSAVQEVEKLYGMPVVAIANLNDLLAFIDSGSEHAVQAAPYREAMIAYRRRYGAN